MREVLIRSLTGMIVVLAVLGCLLAGTLYMGVLLLLILIMGCIELSRLCPHLGKFLIGSIYILLGLSSVLFLHIFAGTMVTIGFFVLIWCSDIFAYVTGSLWGRHKLCPRISPAKTWEGAIGGFVLASGIGYFWKMAFLPGIAPLKWVLFSVLSIVAGMCGDLLESKMKRCAGVKDSGSFLPGHGGILDRFDSVFLAAPVALLVWLVKCF